MVSQLILHVRIKSLQFRTATVDGWVPKREALIHHSSIGFQVTYVFSITAILPAKIVAKFCSALKIYGITQAILSVYEKTKLETCTCLMKTAAVT